MKNRNDNLNEGILDIELAAEQEEIKSRKFKYGTLATIFTVVFIVAIVLVNVLVGYLTDRYVLEIDMTSESLFEISEDTMEVIDDLAEVLSCDIRLNCFHPDIVLDVERILATRTKEVGHELPKP